MTDTELGMELYVVVGNALHLLLRGMTAEAGAQSGLDLPQLRRLDQILNPVPPNDMLASVQGLPSEDRAALSACCLFCLSYAGSETSSVLGAPQELVVELAHRLVDHR